MELNKKVLKKGLKEHISEILKTKKNPNSIALGFSIGSFISILPTPGFNVLLGLLTVFMFSRINKFSLFFALAVWNPLTAIPIYYVSYKLGSALLEGMPAVIIPINYVGAVHTYSGRFLIGNVVLAFIISLVSYVLAKYIFTYYYTKQGHSKKEIKEMLF